MVKTLPFPMQGMQFRSLVGELRSHMLCGAVGKKNLKQNTRWDHLVRLRCWVTAHRGNPSVPAGVISGSLVWR